MNQSEWIKQERNAQIFIMSEKMRERQKKTKKEKLFRAQLWYAKALPLNKLLPSHKASIYAYRKSRIILPSSVFVKKRKYSSSFLFLYQTISFVRSSSSSFISHPCSLELPLNSRYTSFFCYAFTSSTTTEQQQNAHIKNTLSKCERVKE